MAKVLMTIDDCRPCEHSSIFTSNRTDYSVIVCDKTRRVLLVADKEQAGRHKIEIPDDCPLPDFRP
jgi:hypothetical protein